VDSVVLVVPEVAVDGLDMGVGKGGSISLGPEPEVVLV